MMPPRLRDVLDEAAIRHLYEERGLTLRETWEALGSTQRVLERSMLAHGIKARPKNSQVARNALNAERQNRMKQMRDSGMSLSVIGAQFGLSRQRVHRILSEK